MAAWVHGSKMDAASFARHFFGRAADDPVVGSLRAAVSEAVEATTRPQLAASGDLAKAMTAVGLDGWPRFVADAQARAREKATLAAIQKSLQPPDIRKDAIRPVYPVETALVAGAAAVTGGDSGLVGAAARVLGGAIASDALADKPASSGGEAANPPTPELEVEAAKSEPPANEQASPTKASEKLVSSGAGATPGAISTPYGDALQSEDPAAIAARADVANGATLYRIGTMGQSEAAEAQFWSLESPANAGYAGRYGIPAENVEHANFIETATLPRGIPFVTRPAPAVGANPGGGIEVVVPRGSVKLKYFSTQ
jgi:hypothetical protein